MRIVVLDGHTLNPGETLGIGRAARRPRLFDRTPPALVVERARGAEICSPTRRASMRRDREPRRSAFVAVMATATTWSNVAAASPRNVPVSNVPNTTESVAQHTFALLL